MWWPSRTPSSLRKQNRRPRESWRFTYYVPSSGGIVRREADHIAKTYMYIMAIGAGFRLVSYWICICDTSTRHEIYRQIFEPTTTIPFLTYCFCSKYIHVQYSHSKVQPTRVNIQHRIFIPTLTYNIKLRISSES